MCAAKIDPKFRELKQLEIDKIRANDDNPRLDFPEDELEALRQSIATKDVLVPIVVFEDAKKAGHYVLIDGERRFRCARDLGKKTIPAVIAKSGGFEQDLVEMFNIHLVREPWHDMPTAWALEALIKERTKRNETNTDEDLHALTGLSVERLKRLRHALDLPKEYQGYIHDETVPLNFFWELKREVIEPMSKLRPELMKRLGPDNVREAFVNKRLSEVITDTVALRKVRPIINLAAADAEDGEGQSVLDKTIKALVSDPDYTIEEAYEESVELIIEIGKLERKCSNMVKAFDHLLDRAETEAERKKVRAIGDNLVKNLTKVLGRRAR
jgi:ParB family chromosome partitioning protein